jgi:folate-dependent phosphoribosylglycinamide formyltransferase PurN
MRKKIVMLAGGGEGTACMYNGLKESFEIDTVIVEGGTSRKTFLKRRISKLGIWEVFGQMLFTALCVPVLRRTSGDRIEKIKNEYRLDYTPIEADKVKRVSSVNSPECLSILKDIDPDVIIVNGTRIISKKILNAVHAPFINTHVGITPRYRGVHGAYWALAQDDRAHCGVTVHLVDAGIDTGNILYQSIIDPRAIDNFTTYTYMQMGEGIGLMKKAVRDALDNSIKPKAAADTDSKLWYHPTLWGYLYKRVFKGVK